MRPRSIIEEQPASRVAAHTEAGAGTFDNNVRARSRNRGQKPIETAFPGDEFDTPFAPLLYELIVTFSDSQDLVNGFDDGRRRNLSTEHRTEAFPQG